MEDSWITVGPPALHLTLRHKSNVPRSNVDLLSVYTELLVRAVSDNENFNSQPIRNLKYGLLNLLDVVAKSWMCGSGLSILSVAEEPPVDNDPALLKISCILFGSNHEVPVINKSQWCNSILDITRMMYKDDIDCLKRRCSASMWAALVFCNIKHTAARTLDDIRVCKVRISEWDLFPMPMVPVCVNCVKKKHPCAFQYSGASKCRECALFGVACPKAGSCLKELPLAPHIVSDLKRSSPDSDTFDSVPVKRSHTMAVDNRPSIVSDHSPIPEMEEEKDSLAPCALEALYTHTRICNVYRTHSWLEYFYVQPDRRVWVFEIIVQTSWVLMEGWNKLMGLFPNLRRVHFVKLYLSSYMEEWRTPTQYPLHFTFTDCHLMTSGAVNVLSHPNVASVVVIGGYSWGLLRVGEALVDSRSISYTIPTLSFNGLNINNATDMATMFSQCSVAISAMYWNITGPSSPIKRPIQIGIVDGFLVSLYVNMKEEAPPGILCLCVSLPVVSDESSYTSRGIGPDSTYRLPVEGRGTVEYPTRLQDESATALTRGSVADLGIKQSGSRLKSTLICSLKQSLSPTKMKIASEPLRNDCRLNHEHESPYSSSAPAPTSTREDRRSRQTDSLVNQIQRSV
ncbi:hypothetical protein ARMGADRAFT_1086267 [Armillaria gallica]|uniref:Uncharacterized protein n=1 Tax=Armillaria gallica TaxID=47427 RepID=A0A2H3CUQ0_ARMGA|nr:hypothetical protein ARMGADRAFT_1086267 [Armillaria gallica]